MLPWGKLVTRCGKPNGFPVRKMIYTGLNMVVGPHLSLPQGVASACCCIMHF